jgi:exonuclease III
MPLRLSTWNVNGRTSRLLEQAEFLKSLDCSVVALQELTSGSGSRWSQKLSEIGLVHQTPLASVKGSGARRYEQIIASVHPLSTAEARHAAVWPERITSARIHVEGTDIEITTTHIPPGVTHKLIKVEMLEAVVEQIATCELEHQILCGDFNAPQLEQPDGTIITWAQKCSGNLVKWRSDSEYWRRWDAAERVICSGLVSYGMRDVFRELHGYANPDWSWVLKRKGVETPRRFDHVFATAKLKALCCRYCHEAREAGLSDHSPLVADFEVIDA